MIAETCRTISKWWHIGTPISTFATFLGNQKSPASGHPFSLLSDAGVVVSGMQALICSCCRFQAYVHPTCIDLGCVSSSTLPSLHCCTICAVRYPSFNLMAQVQMRSTGYNCACVCFRVPSAPANMPLDCLIYGVCSREIVTLLQGRLVKASQSIQFFFKPLQHSEDNI